MGGSGDIVDQDHQDKRIPVDRLNSTRPGVYYAHIVKVKCKKHGETVGECVHPTAEASTQDLVVECLQCRADAARLELPT